MSSECKAMTRRPLAPEVWEQALINGRIVHPSDDEAVARYADEWYKAQGGLFDPASEPEPVEEPQEEPEGEGEAQEPAQEPQEHAPEHVTEHVTEQVAEQEPVPVPASISGLSHRTRARKEKGRYRGDDPATPDQNEAYTEG